MKSTVEQLADLVAVDTTERFVCPVCGGGSDGERCLAISRYPHGYAYFCHRATCGHRGGSTDFARPMGLHRATAPRPLPQSLLRLVAHPHERDAVGGHDRTVCWDSLQPDVKRELKRLRESCTSNRIYVDSEDPWAIYFECRDFTGSLRGHHLRRRYNGGPKTVRNLFAADAPRPLYAAYQPRVQCEDQVWFVEDPISAAYVAQHPGKVGVALLGTRLDADILRDVIVATQVRDFVIALDMDATALAFKQAREVADLFHGITIRPVALTADLKDTHRHKMACLIAAYEP